MAGLILGACGETDPSAMDSDDPRLHDRIQDPEDMNPGPETPGTEGQPTDATDGTADKSALEKAAPEEKDAPKSEEPAKDKAADDTCYQTCLKNNQARAVAWEMVERDCKASCDGTAPTLEGK